VQSLGQSTTVQNKSEQLQFAEDQPVNEVEATLSLED
jgi:hypothetical protein